jgi:hypothetical protein
VQRYGELHLTLRKPDILGMAYRVLQAFPTHVPQAEVLDPRETLRHSFVFGRPEDWIFLLTILGRRSWSNIIKRVKFIFSLISQLCLQLKLLSSPRAVICHALGASYSRPGPVVLTTYVSSVIWIVDFRSMEGAELEATPCSRLVCRYVRSCRSHLRCVYPYLLTFPWC